MKRITNVLLPGTISVVALTTVLSGCAWAGSDVPLPPCAAATSSESGSDQVSTRIELANGDRVATAVLEDSVAARSLLDQLPVTIQLRDSFGLVMVSELSPGLPSATQWTLDARGDTGGYDMDKIRDQSRGIYRSSSVFGFGWCTPRWTSVKWAVPGELGSSTIGLSSMNRRMRWASSPG